MTREEYLQKLDVEFPGLHKLRQEIYHIHGNLLNDHTIACCSLGLSIWRHCQDAEGGDVSYWIRLTESDDTWGLVPDYVRIFNQILSLTVEEFNRFFCESLSSIISFKDRLREVFRYLFAFEELHTVRDSFAVVEKDDFNEYATFELREKYEVVCSCYRELTFSRN
jgi:hypothetical protein